PECFLPFSPALSALPCSRSRCTVVPFHYVMSSFDTRRSEVQELEQVQQGNQSWWTENPMAYDWHGELRDERLSQSWFDALDERFVHGARLFATDRTPFDRIMPLERLAGKRVLEI